MSAFAAYVLCTSPRSGSTLLCRLLRQTGVAGWPESHFHEPSLQAWLMDHHVTTASNLSEREQVAAVIEAAIRHGRGHSDIFGLRLQSHSSDYFFAKLARLYGDKTTDAERFEAAFGRTAFIHLSRDDTIAQAVSYLKAKQSGLWHRRSDGRELERLTPPAATAYDGAAIRDQVLQFREAHRKWTDWFARERIAPLRLSYEDLADEPHRTLASVLEHLGLDPSAAKHATPDVQRLADEESEDWIKRFRREFGDLS